MQLRRNFLKMKLDVSNFMKDVNSEHQADEEYFNRRKRNACKECRKIHSKSVFMLKFTFISYLPVRTRFKN